MSTTLAIDTHGARAVYDAAVRCMGGDREALGRVGLTAETATDVWRIMQAAYERMSESERAADYRDAEQELRKVGGRQSPLARIL